MDFTTIGVWTKKGLVTYYLLFFMELATRRVHFEYEEKIVTVDPDNLIIGGLDEGVQQEKLESPLI